MAKELKGWFSTKKRPGDRTLDQQLTGLEFLFESITGRTVLDVGCAEGLISIHLIDQGAIAVHGLEVRADHIKIAKKLRKERACMFEVADANVYQPVRSYDIVIMLALLHKLKSPYQACLRFAAAAREMVVLRLPPEHAPIIIDRRSNNEPFDMAKAMEVAGFTMVKSGYIGPKEEWMGFFRRGE